MSFIEMSLYSDTLQMNVDVDMVPVSYTHLDVYKRQDGRGSLVFLSRYFLRTPCLFPL